MLRVELYLLPPLNPYDIHNILSTVSQIVTLFGDSSFVEVIQLK